MAEAVGLAVGFVGLAGLFSTCVDCFKLVQVCSSRSSDYEIFQTMLDNQQFHFMAWGKACGFMDTTGQKFSRFDDPMSSSRNERIEETLERIRSLLTNGGDLKEKYGLKVQRAPIGSKLIEGPEMSAFARAFQSTKVFCSTSLQRKNHITGSIRWAVCDRDKFDRLISDLRELLGDLTKFTQDLGVEESQRLVVEYEMEFIQDETSLEAIAAASSCDNEDDMLSHAASRRLQRVKEQSVADKSIGFDDSISMISHQRYTPSVSTNVDGDMEGAVQEIGITRIPFSQWRKIKTRAGIMPYLKTILVATTPTSNLTEDRDDTQLFSRTNSLYDDAESDDDAESGVKERPIRIAFNSQILLEIFKKVMRQNISPKHNVLVYPFKPLLTHYTRLKGYLAELRTKLERLEVLDDRETTDASCEENNKNPQTELEATKRIFEECRTLIDFVDTDLRVLLDIQNQVRERTLREISFQHVWLLFQPGSIVVPQDSDDSNDLRAYQVLHVTGGRPIIDIENLSKGEGFDALPNRNYNSQEGYAMISSRRSTDFVIDCFYMDFDGERFGPRSQIFVISEFTGQRNVSLLPVYPPDWATTGGLDTRLLYRGRRYLECTAGRWYAYSGPVLQEWDPGHRDTCASCARSYASQEQCTSEVIIDPIAALEQCRNSGCVWNPSFGGGIIAKATKANKREIFEPVDCSIPNFRSCTDVFNDAVMDLDARDRFIRSTQSLKALHPKQLDDDQVILLPYRLCGYSLQSRKWYPFRVDLLMSVEVSSRGLTDLVLPPGHKQMLLSVIRAKYKSSAERDDWSGRQDPGRVLLLHGAPGTGKTATAEAIANSLRKPLMPVRIADLGSTSKQLEQSLTQYIQLADRWSCILLMREAGALLARWTTSDREGNSMSSVLIDVLEGFRGILILTTNRVGVLDDTIMCRIHISLYYPPLDEKATIKLWKLYLDRLQDNQDVSVQVDEILNLAAEMFQSEGYRPNGREIKNAIDTAVAFAQEDTWKKIVRLRTRHVKVVLESSRNFHDYTAAVQGLGRESSIGLDKAKGMRRPSSPDYSNSSSVARDGRPNSTEPQQSAFSSPFLDQSVAGNSAQSDDELKIEELELQLHIARMKKKQRALKIQPPAVRSRSKESESSVDSESE